MSVIVQVLYQTILLIKDKFVSFFCFDILKWAPQKKRNLPSSATEQKFVKLCLKYLCCPRQKFTFQYLKYFDPLNLKLLLFGIKTTFPPIKIKLIWTLFILLRHVFSKTINHRFAFCYSRDGVKLNAILVN